jgi:hypothetical protein
VRDLSVAVVLAPAITNPDDAEPAPFAPPVRSPMASPPIAAAGCPPTRPEIVPLAGQVKEPETPDPLADLQAYGSTWDPGPLALAAPSQSGGRVAP